MMGMEMMLSKMIGLTPEQMKQQVEEFRAMIKGGTDALVAIAESQKRIEAQLEALNNEPRNK